MVVSVPKVAPKPLPEQVNDLHWQLGKLDKRMEVGLNRYVKWKEKPGSAGKAPCRPGTRAQGHAAAAAAAYGAGSAITFFRG
eukprot:1353517-Pyramimonas_sp.AAC.1